MARVGKEPAAIDAVKLVVYFWKFSKRERVQWPLRD